MRYRRYYRRKNPALFAVLCVFLIAIISILLIDAKIRPAVYELAEIQAYSISTEIVNTAVEKLLSQKAPSYSEIVSINFSDNNVITGITTDIVKMNFFKSIFNEYYLYFYFWWHCRNEYRWNTTDIVLSLQ